MSQGEVDYISGLQEGYTGKIESWQHKTSGKGVGFLTLPLLMKALGVVIVVKPLARVDIDQMPLPLEGQLELPLLGGRVNTLPKEHYWVRVAPPKPKKPAKPVQPKPRGKPPVPQPKPRPRQKNSSSASQHASV